MIPTYGSKEAIFSFAQLVVDPATARRTPSSSPSRATRCPQRGAAFAGARVEPLPLLERNGFLPDLDEVERLGPDRALLGQLPEQPDRRDRAARVLRAPGRRSPREHDFLALLGRGVQRALVRRAAALGARARRPGERRRLPDALQALVDDRLPLRASSPPSPEIVSALKTYRPSTGAAPQEFVQRASVVAWGDEAHVERRARRTGGSATSSCRCSSAKGWRVAASEATMYLWVEVPGGESSEAVRRAAPAPRRRRRARAPYLGRVRRGLRPDRARAHARECERAAGDPRGDL